MGWWLSLCGRNLPSGTVGFLKDGIGRRDIRDFHGCRDPTELLAESLRGDGQQDDFGQPRTVLEIRARRSAAFAGVALVSMMPVRARQRLGRLFVVGRISYGNKRGAPPAPPHNILPLSPINKTPRPGNVQRGPNSAGHGGCKPPSYQVTFTGGFLPRAGNV